MKPSSSLKPVYLLDGYGLIYRSYFAFVNRPLLNKRGENTSVVFGFFRTLFALLSHQNPEYLAVAMDSRGPTFRHQRYPQYKANREKAPQDLHSQVPIVVEILNTLGIPIIEAEGYEADDIMARIANQCCTEGRRCYILSSDKDMLQLVNSEVKILKPEKEGYSIVGSDEVQAKWGVTPEQIVDYLSITGDKSDNVPGVMGIGEKGAVELLKEHHTLEEIYRHLDDLKPGTRKKLIEARTEAFLSKELVTLSLDAPVPLSTDSLRIETLNYGGAIPLMEEQGINSLAKQLSQKLEGGGELWGSKRGAAQVDAPSRPTPEQSMGTELTSPQEEERHYATVLDESSLNHWIEEVRRVGVVAFDSETDGLDPMSADPVGFSLSVKEQEGCYIPIRAPEPTLPEELVRSKLKEILEDPSIRIVGQNIKYDYKVLKRWGITLQNIAFDTMVAGWLLDTQGNNFGMDALSERYLGRKTIHFEDVVPKGESFETVPLNEATEYAVEDVDITLRLYHLFSRQLEEQGLLKLYNNTELPLIRILAEMEMEGITLLSDQLSTYGEELSLDLEECRREIWKLCGREFNINSPQQLQVVLFEERKLKPGKRTKTGYSTDVKVLMELAREDPVPALILKHRTLAKLKSTYVDSLPDLINPETGRLHTNFVITGTATGRIASKEPNLQNIPIKEEAGRRIRRAFVPGEGRIFLSADYSQIELVVLAHLSNDPALSEAFRAAKDIHSQTASLLFGIPEGEVAPEHRRIAKTINFGVMYGMSGFRLSRELQIPRDDADKFIAEYFLRYNGIRSYIDTTVAEAEQRGYVSTILGRRRWITGIDSRNRTVKMGAERIAVNTPIQGSGADIMKLAMLAIDRRFKENSMSSRMILQVHDELLFEVLPEERTAVERIVKEEMEGALELSVPLRVSLEFGTSWGELH